MRPTKLWVNAFREGLLARALLPRSLPGDGAFPCAEGRPPTGRTSQGPSSPRRALCHPPAFLPRSARPA